LDYESRTSRDRESAREQREREQARRERRSHNRSLLAFGAGIVAFVAGILLPIAGVPLDAQDEDTGQTLATATFPTDAVPFSFVNADIQFDDVLLTDCVRSATVTIPLVLKVDRFGIGGGAVKKEPVPNAAMAPTIALDTEFANLDQHRAFQNATSRKVELLCGGSTSSGTFGSALNFTAAATKTTAADAPVAGPEVLHQQVTLEVVNDGSGTPTRSRSRTAASSASTARCRSCARCSARSAASSTSSTSSPETPTSSRPTSSSASRTR